MMFCNVRWRIVRAFQLLVQSKNELIKRQALSRVAMYIH